MTTGLGESLRIALYVRDALGINAGTEIITPPLDPPVPATHQVHRDEDMTRAWNTWFMRLLADLSAPMPDVLLVGAVPTEQLRPVVEDLLGAAQVWSRDRKAAHIEDFRRQIHEERVAITRLVRELEQPLGRRAVPFTLHLITLPVSGHWWHRAHRDLLLLSEKTYYDTTELQAVLTPVLQEIM